MIQPSDTNAAKQPRLMGSRTISLAATVCQVRHVFRTLRRSSPTLLLWHCHFPKDLWASPQICNFSSSKLPKFPLLGPSDSMSIGPSHIPSFVQNVVSRHLPVQRYASNVRQALGHPGFGGRSQVCLIPYTQVSIGLAPLPSNRANSHHQDFTFLGDS